MSLSGCPLGYIDGGWIRSSQWPPDEFPCFFGGEGGGGGRRYERRRRDERGSTHFSLYYNASHEHVVGRWTVDAYLKECTSLFGMREREGHGIVGTGRLQVIIHEIHTTCRARQCTRAWIECSSGLSAQCVCAKPGRAFILF